MNGSLNYWSQMQAMVILRPARRVFPTAVCVSDKGSQVFARDFY